MARRLASTIVTLGLAEALRVPLPISLSVPTVKHSQTRGVQHRASSVIDPEVQQDTPKGLDTAGTFDWEKQWYPVLSFKHTDPGRVHAVQLLGKDLAVWRDKDGRWTCFDDRCPHRAAPFTEGRVEMDGSLMCAYHAWRFDADGKCLSIPQSESGGRDEGQAKACARIYPTQVAQNIIWVWGNNGPDASIESALRVLPLLPDFPGLKITLCAIVQRDLPYGWDSFMENVVVPNPREGVYGVRTRCHKDPAHVPVSHHGILGTRDKARPLPLELEAPGVTEEGFAILFKTPVGATFGKTAYVPPSLVSIGTEAPNGHKYRLHMYNSPSRPGWSRMISYEVDITPIDQGPERKMNTGPFGLQRYRLPDWYQHLDNHRFMAQDLVFLHHQEKTLAAAGVDSSNYSQAVFVPAAADSGVMALRKWIAQFAGRGPAWAAGCDASTPPKERERAKLLNVYEQHTKNCTACLGALRRVEQLRAVAKASAAASLVWAALRAARSLSTSTASGTVGPAVTLATVTAMVPGLSATAACLAAAKMLQNLREAFYTTKYHHQDND